MDQVLLVVSGGPGTLETVMKTLEKVRTARVGEEAGRALVPE